MTDNADQDSFIIPWEDKQMFFKVSGLSVDDEGIISFVYEKTESPFGVTDEEISEYLENFILTSIDNAVKFAKDV